MLFAFLGIAAGIVSLRILTLVISNSDLGPDESQYWFWSRTLEFGYFSKPPVIAWAIAATTGVFGNDEWAVRLPAPIFHLGASIFIFLTARSLFGDRAGLWSGLSWLVLPGVTLSSFVIATDAPLLFFWSMSMFALFKIINDENIRLWVYLLLGVGLGFGLMSKYAMIYFPLAIMLVVAFDKLTRSRFLSWQILLSGGIAAAIFTPNVIWNAKNDFKTVSHTADNANWGSNLFQIDGVVTFLAGQFAVAGLILVLAIYAFARSSLRGKLFGAQNTRALFILTITPLLFVSGQAFISRAHANWAAAAYPSLVILTIWAMLEIRRSGLIKSALIAHGLIFVGAGVVLSDLTVADKIGIPKVVQQIRGWDEQTAAISALGVGHDAIVVDDRSLMGAMLYYRRGTAPEVAAIDSNSRISDHYEAYKSFNPERHKNILFVTTRNDAAHVDYRFRKIIPVGPSSVQTGASMRTYHVFELAEYFGKLPAGN